MFKDNSEISLLRICDECERGGGSDVLLIKHVGGVKETSASQLDQLSAPIKLLRPLLYQFLSSPGKIAF